MKAVKDGFWTYTTRYGVVHKALDEKNSACVLVFVHGLMGDCRHTWSKVPEWTIEKSKIDMDVISFSYPSKVLQRTSIPQATDDLRTWLETEFLDRRHIIFVTHSTGGLVVKHMLRQAFRDIEGQRQNGSFDYSSSSSVWFRTRRVINIAVPHTGGSPFTTWAVKTTYITIYPFIVPFLKLIRFLSQGKKDLGWNGILIALRWRNSWLLKLEDEFAQQQKDAKHGEFPYPIIHDIYAKSDLSVPITNNTDQRNIYFRGTHKSVKIPTQVNDPIITIVSDLVGRYRSNITLTLTDYTLLRIAEVNKVIAIDSLIEQETDSAEHERLLPMISSASSGTQAEICEAVIETIHTGSERPRILVVSGTAGVGKSLVLRMIAWRLGRNYLNNPGTDNPLPIVLPLQQITIENENLDTYTWESMWHWWLNWTHNLYSDMQCDFEWLDDKFKNHATVIILDGLDDFLVNHPSLSLSAVAILLRNALGQFANNSQLTIIVGIRSGFPGLQRLVNDPKDIYEVLRLSSLQAEQVFPACKKWLCHIKNPELLELVLTPLILSNYEPDRDIQFDAKSLTQASILDQTIRTIIRRSNLVGIKTEQIQFTEIDHLLFALTLISWIFFYKSRGEINVDVLRTEAGVVRERWEGYFLQNKLSATSSDIVSGFKLVEDITSCKAILQRTIFIETGPGMTRFSHRSWQEFLLAQYFTLCLKWGFVDDFGVTAFNSNIYRMAGDVFQNTTLTEDRIKSVLDSWRKSRNTYVTGNVIAFLAWTRTSVDTQAIQLLLKELSNFQALSRVVLLAGLGYRVLVNHPDDRSVVDLRRTLLPKLCEFSNLETAPVDDPVACSLAWCYQKAFAELFGSTQPEIPWPAIGFTEAETAKALPMICTTENEELIVDTRSRSLQLAFLVPILDAYRDHHLVIRALHYLYYLVVAVKHNVHILELSQELPQILAPGCEFEKIIESYSLVPEILQLYRKCQEIQSQYEKGAF